MSLFDNSSSKGINVLMMGGRRCGKTSALASMFDQFIKGRVNNFFTISDQTKLETGKVSPLTNIPEDQDSLGSKKLELMDKLEHPTTDTFLVDAGPTYNEWRYVLNINLPGHPRKSTTINFIDCPGEYFQKGSNLTLAQNLIGQSDVFVVVVDTPYMMEGSKAVHSAVNCVDSVQNLVSSIDNEGGAKAKMVIFVPIKCEKWVKEGRINEVTAKIKQDYSVPINTLKAYQRMNICILPIETAGNILFSELKDPYTITINGETMKCSKMSDRFVRLSDGSPHDISDTDIVNTDAGSAIPGCESVRRPHSWFHINLNADPNNLYQPHNCEQLPLHILSFMTKKMSVEGHGTLYSFIFGGISRNEMDQKMREIAQSNLIKNGTEGIEYIKRDI